MIGHTIGLYVHWPYCTRLCPYCDFNIYKNKPETEEALIAAIVQDMTHWRTLSGPRQLQSIHFGGGTPSLISARNLARLIEQAMTLWSPVSGLEIGLEANPNTISAPALAGWRAAGVERLSIGVQSFDGQVLKFLGRDHDGAQAQAALERAVKTMPRVSADLIYGWVLKEGRQSLDGWQSDLNTALHTGVTHISAYQLTIEAGTAFGRSESRGDTKAVDPDQSADLYELGLEVLGGAGFSQYEVSNFAQTRSAQSRHNLLYWQGDDYIGVGPGAHGRLTVNGTRTATICALKPNAYIDHVAATGTGTVEKDILSGEAWAQEYLLMGLRISQGISLSRYAELSGQPLNTQLIKDYVDAKLLLQKNDHIATTPAGRLVLDRLSHELLLSSA
ncbi:MAG: coproporphyrinogen III oxidase [Robiginitomaculum sp.]|nr:MAG: coproporphyrinogen III oxidase [Robiginitomaculum sp.]